MSEPTWTPASATCRDCGQTATNFEDETEAAEWLQEHECEEV